MKRALILSAAMLALTAVPATGHAATQETKTSKDLTQQKPVPTADFVKKASMTDMFEIRSAELAMEKSKATRCGIRADDDQAAFGNRRQHEGRVA